MHLMHLSKPFLWLSMDGKSIICSPLTEMGLSYRISKSTITVFLLCS